MITSTIQEETISSLTSKQAHKEHKSLENKYPLKAKTPYRTHPQENPIITQLATEPILLHRLLETRIFTLILEMHRRLQGREKQTWWTER